MTDQVVAARFRGAREYTRVHGSKRFVPGSDDRTWFRGSAVLELQNRGTAEPAVVAQTHNARPEGWTPMIAIG